MTPFRLVFEEGPLGAHGHATYKRSDLALVYAPAEDRVATVHMKRGRAIDPRFGIYEHPVFLIADTLTLRFGEDRALTGLDAYTNDKLWAHEEEESQVKLSGRGRLTIDWHADSDRVRLPGIPRFVLAPGAQRLHIHLESARASDAYYDVGTSLTVGLGAGAIREIIIADLAVT
jgi:hypothetical protein